MNILGIPCVAQFLRMCNDGWEQNWHERNGGNLTYLMSDEDVAACKPFFHAPLAWVDMGVADAALGGRFFISTGSGKYFRNVMLAHEENIGIVEINATGSAWRVVWGLVNDARPTSEFPTHYLNHVVRYRATNGKNRVIYHAHPTNIVAMTYVLPLCAREFSRALWQSMTECAVVFPHGVGVVPWLLPGGAEIAHATCKVMEEFTSAVWAFHGLFAAGETFDEAFGLIHTIENAAEIYMTVLHTGKPVLQTITDENLKVLTEAFGAKLNPAFI
ncbi:MAG: rhamnulose-1-phosphate aldolase [Defluviitaleaceae bacterium]|nr:rhamnulose-1-phosphate aldolase [Defluviitaleaceae bacterium]